MMMMIIICIQRVILHRLLYRLSKVLNKRYLTLSQSVSIYTRNRVAAYLCITRVCIHSQ